MLVQIAQDIGRQLPIVCTRFNNMLSRPCRKPLGKLETEQLTKERPGTCTSKIIAFAPYAPWFFIITRLMSIERKRHEMRKRYRPTFFDFIANNECSGVHGLRQRHCLNKIAPKAITAITHAHETKNNPPARPAAFCAWLVRKPRTGQTAHHGGACAPLWASRPQSK